MAENPSAAADQMVWPEISPLTDGRLTIITTHVNADFDAVASMIAAGKLYPGAVMVFPGSQEKNLRNFFIQSMIYLFNVARVKDIDLAKVGRLVLVDTRQAERIGALARVLENRDLSIHVYDHHPDGPDDIRGEVEIMALVGANATIMTEILTEKGLGLSPEEATVLILGIYEDTGSFVFRSTTPRDYRAAARLLEYGADLNVVGGMISRELTADQVALLYELINSAQTHNVNGYDIVIAQTTTEHYVDDLAVLVHKMMDMQNVSVMFALANMEGRTYVVARSRLPQVNVAEIAQELGGGGHPSAAAATVRDLTLPQITSKLLLTLAFHLGPVRTARDIMSHPVISVAPESSMSEASELLIRYNINVLVVLDPDGAVLGYVSRQNVSKALYHGLPSYPVSEFMTTEFGTVGPEATFDEIQALIVEQKQRVLPVIENGRAVGVITRTDLLHILTSETKAPSSLVEDSAAPRTGRTKKVVSLMRERLPRKIVDLLADLGRTAGRLSFGAYVVGGFIRDLFLRQENLDIDVVIEGDAIRFAELYAQEHPGLRVRAHHKFKTAVLIFPDGFKLDLTTARVEYYEHPAALPIVQGGSLHLDLFRRDFTINTLAVSLLEKDFGTLIDYFRGLKDLKEGYIRALHNLSFVEDPTRVFRAIRFEQRFGFKIGKHTANLIQNAVKHDFFLKLSGKRLAGEIRQMLQEDDPGPAVARMSEFDLLKFIHPAVVFDRRRADLFRRIKRVEDWFHLTFADEKYYPWILFLQALLTDLSRQEMSDLGRRLSLTKKEKQILIEERPSGERALAWLTRKPDPKPSEVYLRLTHLTLETILFMMAKSPHDDLTRVLAGYLTRYKNIRPALTGDDLIKLGLAPGPRFKKILTALLEARLNGEISSRKEEVEFVRRNYPTPPAI
ncbi:MAG: CBS domain-containing protein [Thermodesulfobacteriota bacterium]